jgi:ATP-dependent DNA helicase RecQ
VIVLNPLDALGDDQVTEKIAANYTAINLTASNFDTKAEIDVWNGVFNFIYLSPEIFLNNKTFEEIYISPNFQKKLVLVVVDKAHMIYTWGLAETGNKVEKILARHQDQGVFRISYGNIGSALLNKNKSPLLMMSATCPPKAIEAITDCLKLTEEGQLHIIRGELTRPEIHIIRIPMSHSLCSCEDIASIYPLAEETPSNQLVPTLIYSGTRHLTLKVLEVLAAARGTHGDHLNAGSLLGRRYHACTGKLDKEDCIEEFGQGKFPLISCTLALGMGQNWRTVRQVVHIGRGDPSLICQMIGRAGRDGNPALAVLYMDPSRKGGKNDLLEFADGPCYSDEDRMDALALTPVCLRVAFGVDNLYVFCT